MYIWYRNSEKKPIIGTAVEVLNYWYRKSVFGKKWVKWGKIAEICVKKAKFVLKKWRKLVENGVDRGGEVTSIFGQNFRLLVPQTPDSVHRSQGGLRTYVHIDTIL